MPITFFYVYIRRRSPSKYRYHTQPEVTPTNYQYANNQGSTNYQ